MFISLILVQVLIFNQIQLSGFVNPYVYILFILLLPHSTPTYLLLILSFFIGLVVDIFLNSIGVHAAASVLIGYLRPYIIRIISNREDDRSDYPGLSQNTLRWFVSYVSIAVIFHHILLFYLEVFSFSHFFVTLGRAMISSLFSIFIIVLSQFLVFRD
jgi:rod shape-determining protein MreD